jgi:hypothetical protein
MHFGKFSFGALRIDGTTYEQDVVIDALCGAKSWELIVNKAIRKKMAAGLVCPCSHFASS